MSAGSILGQWDLLSGSLWGKVTAQDLKLDGLLPDKNIWIRLLGVLFSASVGWALQWPRFSGQAF